MSFFHRSHPHQGLRRHVLSAWLLIAALLTLVVPSLPQARAAAKTVHFSTSIGSITTGMLSKSTVTHSRVRRLQPTSRHRQALPFHSPYATRSQHARQASAANFTANAPSVAGAASVGTSTSIVHNFEGLTAVDQANFNFFDVEPPDQALCSHSGYVLEAVNGVMNVYNSSGLTQTGGNSLLTTFEPLSADAVTDPRCYYDPTSKTWFFVLLAYDSFLSSESHLDVAVFTNPLDVSSWTIYHLDTTDSSNPGCPCLGDQPLLGVDAHGVFLSTNEFDLATGAIFKGAQVYAVDKKQLVAKASSVYLVHYHGITNGGTPAASMEPAITRSSSPAEYFLDSLDPNNTTDNRLGVWAITNDAVLDTKGIPTMSGIVITSQTYGLPPNALQKGTTNLLQTDDDRMLQVQNVNGTLWSSLDTVVHVSGDTANRAGAAWFKIVPKLNTSNPPKISGATISAQGIVASSGRYILYPAVAVNDINDAAMVFSESGSTIYPSIYYATGPTFTTTALVVTGSTFDMGFTCSPCRWGDYSAALWSDQVTGTRRPYIWMASSYIADSGDGTSNWSTRVAEVVPQGG